MLSFRKVSAETFAGKDFRNWLMAAAIAPGEA
jgi:hypothetical protein